MRITEKQELVKKLKRLALFFAIVFVPVLVVSVVVWALGAPMWTNILVLLVVLSVMFIVFSYVCAKLDEKKKKRMAKKKDPFAD